MGKVAESSMRVDRETLTLRGRAADILRQAITNQTLAPGTHLKERELCEMLGVSRTSVREALRHLESEHLIKTIPHRGPVVVALTAKDAEDLYKTRSVLEGLAGEQFAANATNEHLAAIDDAARKMALAASAGEVGETLALIELFYEVLLDGTGNRVCAQLIQSLKARIAAFRLMSLSSNNRRNQMMAEIHAIVAAAERRDPDATRIACVKHVEAAYEAIKYQLYAQMET